MTCARDCGNRGKPDDIQLAYAASEGRILVSRNYRDFTRWTREFAFEQQPHAGVLLVAKTLPGDAYAAIVAALVAYSQANPEPMPPYMIDYLHPASG